jgi:hypothetical protein
MYWGRDAKRGERMSNNRGCKYENQKQTRERLRKTENG